jgi:enediyne biosynthesis protein E4
MGFLIREGFLYSAAVIAASAAVAAAVWYYPAEPGAPTPEVPRPAEHATAAPAVDPPKPRASRPAELPAGIDIRFADVTAAAGIDFRHYDGRTDMEYIMDETGAGVGWLDYDQDGLMDLFLVQGASFTPPYAQPRPASKLYRNLGGGRFKDVTADVGLGHVGCGQGVAVGDIDNDGYPDLFLTCYGKPNVLYHNVPDGKGGRRFADITAKAGLADHPDWHERPNWSTSAAFLDYNGDGRLDLFVCSYVKIDLGHYPLCENSRRTRRGPCPPRRFEGTRCLLYRNNGDGTFTDVSKEAGIDAPDAKALGVVALDLDDDGKPDLYVANDTTPNFLFHNLGNGRFESVGPVSGCAVSLEGEATASMGVDADDLDGDGRPDLFVTTFARETKPLYRNEGGGQFLDASFASGLGSATWHRLGFGTAFLDADRDGNLDLFISNGHVSRHIDDEGDPNLTFRQKAQLFLNNGRGRFQDISERAGGYFGEGHVGRGLALCDYDNDGLMDAALNNSGEPAVLLHNESKTPNHWLRLELHGTKSNRDAVGARVTLHLPGGRKLVRHRKGGGSYLSACDPRLLVGLGAAARIERVEVRWPSGLLQQVGPLAADRGYLVVEGDPAVRERP